MALIPIVFVAIIGYSLFKLAVWFQLFLTRRSFYRLNKCGVIKQLPQSERIIGLGLVRENLKAGREKRLLENGLNRFEKHGNTYQISMLGSQAVITREPENVKAVLATQFKDFALGRIRKDAFFPLLGNGIFTNDGADWEHSRALVRPNFVRNQVADLRTFETHVSNLLRNIPKDKSTVDLQSLFFCLTLDSATEFLFGESVNSLSDAHSESARTFAQAFNDTQEKVALRTRNGPLMRFFVDDKFTKQCDYVKLYADRIVRGALEKKRKVEGHDLEKDIESDGTEPRERYCFLDELVKEIQDPVRVRDELLNILLAGRDTTASLLSNTFHVLANRPEIYAKLRADVATLNGDRPTYDQLRNLKFVKCRSFSNV
jgi:cytochrome P450